MRTLLFILFFIPSICFSQTEFRVNYNKIVDFDGKVRKEVKAKGTWYLIQDSVLVQKYDIDSLIYNVIGVKGRHVYYRNDFNETIEVVFMNDMVTVRSNLRPKQYIIFRKK